MLLMSWNVNGLRACINKGFLDFLDKYQPDIIGIQETKMQESQLDKDIPGYYKTFNDAIKLGYSGTLILSKEKPINVYKDFELSNLNKHNDEGRVLTYEFNKFYFITTYVPNSKDGLIRLDYRMQFDSDLRNYINELRKNKDVIICGDFNVAHEPIDIKNAEANQKNAGFSIEERTSFTKTLSTGFVDTFRYLYPTTIKYSWWSNRFF